jgi:hypothetical protein
LFLLVFLSSQPLSYHFVALILTIALLADDLLKSQRMMLCGCAVMIYAMICGPLISLHWVSPAGWQNLLFFPRLALMTAFGGILLWQYVSPSAETERVHVSFKSLAIAGCALVVLVVAGFISTQRHLRGQFDNYQARIVSIPGAIFASNPAVAADDILFTAMTQWGYTIRSVHAGSTQDFPRFDGDWFHPTVARTGLGWAEQASRSGSRVVRFSTNVSGQNVMGVTAEVENAKEPVVSSDGQFLAFLRPFKGRNALWVQKIATTGEDTSAGEREIAGPEYDVREAGFFPDHRLVFSSGRTGQFEFYTATTSGKLERLKDPNCSVRYPAVSPDGRWLAFSCEHGGNWQLHVMNLRGNEDLQLSSAECNSISPAWTADSKHLIYATDCGRGLGLTALAEMTLFH